MSNDVIDGLPPALAALDRPVVMGVLNVTADSFSDGGKWLDPEHAIAHGLVLSAQGADIVDVGGESTRPGAQRISVDTELERVVPVVRELSAAGVWVSIDTMRAEVADACVRAGAVIVNDVSGGLADPQMSTWLSGVSVPYIAMHWRGTSDVMENFARYDDVVGEVCNELQARLDALIAAGVSAERIILDPGLGFAKHSDHNWALLSNLAALRALGRPILIGASRKRFLGSLLADATGPRPDALRDVATDAISALAAANGTWGVRVHDVRGSLDSLLVGRAWTRGHQ